MELQVETDSETGDFIYTGPIFYGLSKAREQRHVKTVESEGEYRVEFSEQESPWDVTEFGTGSTPGRALRFAIGALFAPEE